MSEIRLSTKQREIVEADDGAILVLAVAGSGKTRVLTERVRYLISNKPGKFKVLALTFTNKAAEEMQNRLKGLADIQNRTFIGTIHKFCLELIRSQGTAIGMGEMPHIFERENDRLEVLIEVFNNNPILKQYLNQQDDENKKKKYLYDVLGYVSQKKKDLCGIVTQRNDEDEELSLVFNEYNAVLASQNAIDFDDVICLAYKIFAERPKVAELYRKMFRYICIDEAQDLNFAQYELIKILCGEDNKNVLMVGDPNQAIYGFNGSNKAYMIEHFLSDFAARKIILLENYRSSKKVLEAANKLIPDSSDASVAAIEGEFEIVACNNEFEEASWIAEKIKAFLKNGIHPDIEGEITPDNIAILARNKYVFQEVEKKLKEENIGYFFKKTNDTSEYESDLIKAFDLGIRVLVNPVDKLHFQQLCSLLNASLPDISVTKGLQKLKNLLSQLFNNENEEDLKALIKSWEMIDGNINTFPKALALIEEYINTSNYYLTNLEVTSLVTQDINQFKETWKQYSMDSSTDTKSLAGFRNQIALGIPVSKNIRNIGVTLGTIHSVKGLEFEIVFLMGMNEGTFPDYRAVKSSSALNEEKNNAFVAITRSKRLLYVSYPRQKFMPWDKNTPVVQKPSRFISLIR